MQKAVKEGENASMHNLLLDISSNEAEMCWDGFGSWQTHKLFVILLKLLVLAMLLFAGDKYLMCRNTKLSNFVTLPAVTLHRMTKGSTLIIRKVNQTYTQR